MFPSTLLALVGVAGDAGLRVVVAADVAKCLVERTAEDRRLHARRRVRPSTTTPRVLLYGPRALFFYRRDEAPEFLHLLQ